MIDQLVTRVGAAAGLDQPTAEKAVGLILGFLQKEAPAEHSAAMLENMPGAAGLIEKYAGGSGGMMGALGGMMGSMGGGVMALGTQLMGAGLSMGQINTVSKELFAYGRETVGEDTMGAIVGSIPGLSQFV